MRIRFLGAAREVTGSRHLLEVNGHKLLLDFGLVQGSRKKAFEANRQLSFAAGEIEAILLSHAHIDHSGNLPRLAQSEFTGTVYSTPATRSLATHMLLDSAHIQEKDVAYINKKRKRWGKKPFEPLYRREDALEILRHFVSIGYQHPFEPVPGVRAQFLDAGHILGSAMVQLDITENGNRTRMVFSGDLGREGMPFLRRPHLPEGVNVLLMESTYGNREHGPLNRSDDRLRQVVQETWQRGGKLLIPSFALGRTQGLVFRLNEMERKGELPPVDVFVDSPLAVSVTEVFRMHPECYSPEAQRSIEEDPDHDPLGFPRLRYVRRAEESKQLNTLDRPAIIISASGMCESGRILHHLKNNISDARSTVLFVGFQAQNTLGRRLRDGADKVNIFGESYEVRARIESIDGFSAHADRNELLAWAGAVRSKSDLQQVFLVHGEEEAARSLAEALQGAGVRKVSVPEKESEVEI